MNTCQVHSLASHAHTYLVGASRWIRDHNKAAGASIGLSSKCEVQQQRSSINSININSEKDKVDIYRDVRNPVSLSLY